MKNLYQVLIVALIISLLPGCGPKPVSIRTNETKGADFSAFKTFHLLPEPPKKKGSRQPPKPFHRRVVESAVRDQLIDNGYREVRNKDKADMLVAIQFSLHDEQRTRNVVEYNYQYNNYGGYNDYYGYGYRNYYGYSVTPYSTVQIEDIRQGNMVIDIIDRAKNEMIWEGFAQGQGETDFDAMERRINNVVEKIFQRFGHRANDSAE